MAAKFDGEEAHNAELAPAISTSSSAPIAALVTGPEPHPRSPEPTEPRVFLPRTAVGITQLFSNLAVIGALIVAGLTFWKQQQDIPRVKAALMVSNLSEDRLADARSILFKLWADKDLQQFESGMPTDFKRSLVRKTIETSRIPETDIIEAIVSLTNFYDEVQICVEKLRCEQIEIDENLGRYSVAFYCLYRSEIEDVRKRLVLKELGDGLSRFVVRQGGC